MQLFQLTASQGGWQLDTLSSTDVFLFQLTASQGGWQEILLTSYPPITFQLTASQGGWLPLIPFWISLRAISTHSLTRRLTNTKQKYRWTSSFQLTASQGGWLRRIRESCVKGYFNSQPHKEADHKCVWLCNWLEYFNSQPHKEADNFHQFFQLIPEISTHSLTRRLTISRQGNYHMYIFQLTASQGGWLIYIYIKAILGLFQLTASQGGWRLTRYCAVLHDFYFNSQPHKEADSVSIQCIFRHGNFNSQPHKEADTSFRFLYTFASFQLTASQGGWPGHILWRISEFLISTHSLTRRLTEICHITRWIWRYFNSQPHKEADWSSLSDIRWIYISTHSLTRRLTHGSSSSSSSSYISTHSLTRRLTETEVIEAVYGTISTHSLTRRLTESGRTDDTIMHISTHSLTRRLTHDTCCTTLQTRYFNSQPHKEADEFLVSDTIAHFIFQLTASQGGWRQMLCCNPEYSNISTHSLTRRLTMLREVFCWWVKISTHSLTRRLTITAPDPSGIITYFNSQPHKEADVYCKQ